MLLSTISVFSLSVLQIAGFLEKELSFRASIADALNKAIENLRRRKHSVCPFTCKDIPHSIAELYFLNCLMQ